jgi:hypothetical protein
MDNPFDDLPESQLIAGCASGNREAWAHLIACYQPDLEVFLWSLLVRRGIKDANVVETIVSNVWSEQLEGKSFTTYDPERGTLHKYLCGLARNHVLRWLHTRALMMRCEHELMRRKSKNLADGDGTLMLLFGDFLAQASPRERAYIHRELLKDWPANGKPLSAVNKRQLQHRAERRLCKLLGLRARRLVRCCAPRARCL